MSVIASVVKNPEMNTGLLRYVRNDEHFQYNYSSKSQQ
jgi:hypothetical protein